MELFTVYWTDVKVAYILAMIKEIKEEKHGKKKHVDMTA